LSWYNKAYRTLNDYLIQPTLKHRNTILAASILAAVPATIWYYSDRGGQPGEANPQGFFARMGSGIHNLEHWFRRKLIGYAPRISGTAAVAMANSSSAASSSSSCHNPDCHDPAPHTSHSGAFLTDDSQKPVK